MNHKKDTFVPLRFIFYLYLKTDLAQFELSQNVLAMY